MAGLTSRGIGQRYIIGIGGDPIKGVGFTECLALFNSDPEVSQIVLVGEIGGHEELKAADYIKEYVQKPLYGYIAGHSAPVGVQLGHAGAILGSDMESAQAKTKALRSAGVTMFESVHELIGQVPHEPRSVV
jgi:succinyl-CoA synthetase alpha subunit